MIWRGRTGRAPRRWTERGDSAALMGHWGCWGAWVRDFGKLPALGTSGDWMCRWSKEAVLACNSQTFQPRSSLLSSISVFFQPCLFSQRRVVNSKGGMLISALGSGGDPASCTSPPACLLRHFWDLSDGLSLLYSCPTDRASLCWPGVVASLVPRGCLGTDAGEVPSWNLLCQKWKSQTLPLNGSRSAGRSVSAHTPALLLGLCK